MGFLSKLLGRSDAARRDAARLYSAAMTASRRPEFFGAGKITDNYDGRIDLLSLHLAVIIRALNTHGEQGKRLAQALYEEMRDDWDVALREEGMSDTGTMKRIKPMIRLFYTRLKAYTDGLDGASIEQALHISLMAPMVSEDEETSSEERPHQPYVKPLSDYAVAFAANLSDKSLGDIALVKFDIPPPPAF